ncbi:MAG: hypothetical protein ACPG5B_08985 [Chitinophagales bacterium]
MTFLNQKIIKSFQSAIAKLSGYERRIFLAELTQSHFDNSSPKAAEILEVSENDINLGQEELESGLRCFDKHYSQISKNRWN